MASKRALALQRTNRGRALAEVGVERAKVGEIERIRRSVTAAAVVVVVGKVHLSERVVIAKRAGVFGLRECGGSGRSERSEQRLLVGVALLAKVIVESVERVGRGRRGRPLNTTAGAGREAICVGDIKRAKVVVQSVAKQVLQAILRRDRPVAQWICISGEWV